MYALNLGNSFTANVANLARSTLPRQAWMQSRITYHDTLEIFYLYIHAARQKN